MASPGSLSTNTKSDQILALPFQFGYNGAANQPNYLDYIYGPSNLSGAPVNVRDAKVNRVSFLSSTEAGYTIEIIQHSGGLANAQVIGELSVVPFGQKNFSEEDGDFTDFLIDPIFDVRQIAIRMKTGGVSDLRVQVYVVAL